MKKRFGSFLFIPLLLVSCSPNENIIYSITNLDINEESAAPLVRASAEKIDAMYEGLHQFPLFVYQEGCGHCAQVNTLLTKYARQNETNLYTLDANSEDFNALKESIPEYFYAGLSTPTIYIFKQGKARHISQEVMEDEVRLFRTLDQYLKKYKIYTVYNDVTALNTYLEQDEYITLTINGNAKEDYLLFETIFSYIARISDKNTLLIDYNKVGSDMSDRLNVLFDNNYEHQAIIKKNNTSTFYDIYDEAEDFLSAAMDFYLKD